MVKRVIIVGLLALGGLVAGTIYDARHPLDSSATAGSEIEVVDGLTVTYLATPALFDQLGIHPRREFGVASNGNVIMNADEGVIELETKGGVLAAEKVEGATPLDAMAIDDGAVMLGIQGRFFGQVGPEGFQKALVMPKGALRLAASSRPGWVYLVRNSKRDGNRIYQILDDGTMSVLAEFPHDIRAVADDEKSTFVSTNDALFALDASGVRVISKVTTDLGRADSLAAGPEALFLTANGRVYVLAGEMLLAIARGISPELILAGNRLYCWDHRRRLLLSIDVGPLLHGDTT